ncbi:MAG: hypothetical protein JWM99_5146 [Verrucomicrobiales bacterium]|nr:hypothetical protein [Verrucomicrobiales bacterium]
MKKPRSDSPLLNLPQPEKDKLNGWLLTHPYHKVQELISQPAPAGFGLKAHISSIGRYYQKAMPQYLENIRDDRSLAAAQLSVGTDGAEEIEKATLDALRCRLFRLSLSDQSDTNEIARMFRLVDKLRSNSTGTRRS